MSEGDVIDRSAHPATVSSLVDDLRALGVDPGMTLLVHSSLSRLGYVAGGAHAVVAALSSAVGASGTLVMPTHSTDLSDPASWSDPPVPAAWWDRLRAEMPAYDPMLTPTRGMGAIVECFRHTPGALRSDHPTVSAAAVGPDAEFIVAGHELACGLGESSPQARVYDLDGHILLLGVSHSNNTSLHLSEYRAVGPDAEFTTYGSPVRVNGSRRWVTYRNLVDDDEDFEVLGEDFAEARLEQTGRVGSGQGRLMRARDIVDFGTDWIQRHRR